MTKVEQSIIINRPVEQVWNFIIQVEENAPKWDRGVLAARVISDGPLGVGTEVETRSNFFGRERIGKVQVTTWLPLRKIGMKNLLGQVKGEQSYSFEPLENGTKLIMDAEIDSVGWWKLIASILLRKLKSDGEADLANIKRILETTPYLA